eukprot:5196000-Alexandrium_andersonii.AAC.1
MRCSRRREPQSAPKEKAASLAATARTMRRCGRRLFPYLLALRSPRSPERVATARWSVRGNGAGVNKDFWRSMGRPSSRIRIGRQRRACTRV